MLSLICEASHHHVQHFDKFQDVIEILKEAFGEDNIVVVKSEDDIQELELRINEQTNYFDKFKSEIYVDDKDDVAHELKNYLRSGGRLN